MYKWIATLTFAALVATAGVASARTFTLDDLPQITGVADVAISPDGTEVCYSMNADAVPATSTNSDLYVVPIAGGQTVKITATPGADASPRYSPDGKYLAWRAQFRAGLLSHPTERDGSGGMVLLRCEPGFAPGAPEPPGAEPPGKTEPPEFDV